MAFVFPCTALSEEVGEEQQQKGGTNVAAVLLFATSSHNAVHWSTACKFCKNTSIACVLGKHRLKGDLIPSLSQGDLLTARPTQKVTDSQTSSFDVFVGCLCSSNLQKAVRLCWMVCWLVRTPNWATLIGTGSTCVRTQMVCSSSWNPCP